MEAIKLMSSEAKRPDLLDQAQVMTHKGLGPSLKQPEPVNALQANAPASDDLDAGEAITREALNATVSKLSDYVQSVERSLSFSVDEDSGRTVIKVTDLKTDQVIRQMPPEEALNILRYIASSSEGGSENRQGFLVRKNA